MDEQSSEASMLTYRQVSRRFNVKVGTLYSWVAQHRIPHVRMGRRFVLFPRAELEAFFAAHLVPVEQGNHP